MIKRLIFFILFLLPACVTAQEKATDTLRVGDVAPPVYLRTLDGKDFFLRDYSGTMRSPKKKSYIVVFSFFATWCKPCKKEIPHLIVLQEQYKSKDVKILLIDVGEEPEKVKEFVKANGVTLPVLMDRYSLVSKKYGAKTLPTLVVIGKDGNVKAIRSGYTDGDEKKLDEILKELL